MTQLPMTQLPMTQLPMTPVSVIILSYNTRALTLDCLANFAAEVIGWDSLDGVPFKKKWSESLGKTVQEAYKRLVVESGKVSPVPKKVIALHES